MVYNVVLLPGDGVGKEVMAQGRAVLEGAADRFNLTLDLREFPCGGEYYLAEGREWPEGTFELCRDWSNGILLGAVGWPGAELPGGDIAGAGVIFGLRFGLDLYANVRPTKLYPNVPHKISGEFKSVWAQKNVDFVTVRENTEGAYTPIKGYLDRGGERELAVDDRVITAKGAKRVAHFAYDMAVHRDQQRKVTCVDKSNVLAGCRLFRACFDRVGEHYPTIEKDYAYIDAFTQWMIRNPEWFDVVVTPNMFGDIATDLAAVLQGGLGMATSGNIGTHHGMFEPVHGSAPRHAGKDKVNPTGMILAVKMMLEWWGVRREDKTAAQAAEAIESALVAVLARGDQLTYDLGGSARCSQFGAAVTKELTQS